MKVFINGRPVDVPSRDDGSINSSTLRAAAGIDPNRALVLQQPNGSNQIVNPNTDVNVNPNDYFTDLAPSVRGA